jgi:hypothetical protein
MGIEKNGPLSVFGSFFFLLGLLWLATAFLMERQWKSCGQPRPGFLASTPLTPHDLKSGSKLPQSHTSSFLQFLQTGAGGGRPAPQSLKKREAHFPLHKS